MQTIEVTNCAECPFGTIDLYENTFYCSAKDFIYNPYRDHKYWYGVHPLCPLKQQSITVKLKDDENSKRCDKR